jgi:uncharacterized repeat protein (TIGR01451 family)
MMRRLRWLATFACVLLALLGVGSARAQVVRSFTPRFSTNGSGDVLMIGNTLMSCSGNGQCPRGRDGTGSSTNNNDLNMSYVDVDADGATFCSSNSQLAMPAGATVLWAGLYWSGDSNNGARNTVRFSTPVAAYTTLTATQLDLSGTVYQGFVDVTARVLAGGNGTYTVANVQSTEGTNEFAGWSLVVVFADATAPGRNLVVFDGYASVAPGATVSFGVSGFVTPPAGAVNTRLGVVAGEGDLGFTGDSFLLNGTAVGDALNPTTNFFNSSITRFGAQVTAKNPNYVNQYGFDIDQLSLVNKLPNGATSATITLSSTDDQFYPGVVTFVTDLYAPVFGNGSFTKTVTDVNGGSVHPGDVLEYTLTMTNSGQDGATSVVMRDTLPANTTYVPGTLSIVTGANLGAKTDATGDDQMDYVGASRSVVARLGTGATAAAGGAMAVNATTSVRFRASVNSPAPNGSVVSNQGRLAFNGAQLGTALTASSDGNGAVGGDQATTVTVVAPVVSGTVFEDANYGGGVGRSLATSAGVARPNVRLEIYDGTGAYAGTATTDATGRYAFDGYAAGSYIVRVVETGVTSSRPGSVVTLVPVLTYRTDAGAGAAVAVTDRVGGEIPSKADAASNTTSLTLATLTTASATPQSTSPVTLGTSDVGGMDFGYNFDTIVNANDAGRGTFRQFLTAAAALGNAGLAQSGKTAGVEYSLFMVSDGGAHPGLRAGLPNLLTSGVVLLFPSSNYPALTDAATRVDGGTQTANVGNTNPVTLGAGGAVGVDALALPSVSGPEVELRDAGGFTIGLDLQAANLVVTGLAIDRFGNTPASNIDAEIRVGATASNALIQNCVLGATALSFADPGFGFRSGGDHVRVLGGDNGTLSNTLIGYTSGAGVALTAGSDGWQVIGCEIRSNALGQPARDGLSIEASGSATVRGNLITSHEGAGIDARTSTGANTFENNTVTRSGIGTGATVETPGIGVGGNGSRVDRNILFDNFGAGVLVISTAATNTITRNSIYGNGGITNNGGTGPSAQIGIDLLKATDNSATGTSPVVTLNDNGDGDAGGNGLLNHPVLETALVSSGNLTLTGWARPGSTIEWFVAAADPSGFGEGKTYVTTLTEGSAADLDASSSAYSGTINGIAQGSDNTNRFRFTLAAPSGVSSGVRLTATATVSGATSEFSGLVTVGGGVGVSGFAYADANHDLSLDAGEVGTGATLYAKLISSGVPGSAQSVVAVDPATGAYAFGVVAAGTWSIVLDDSPLASDVVPALPAGWIGTEAASGVRSGVVVGATSVSALNFGLWHGSRADGVVFRDDGSGGGVPNDGVAQIGEAGIAGARVRLLAAACAGGACDSALTDGAGRYTLWLPFAAVGATVRIGEVTPTNWLSTGGSGGTTGGAYSRATDAVDFVAASGASWTGVNFGDVPANSLAPSGARSGAPGAAVFHPHTYVAGSSGSVTFSTTRVTTPAIPGWGVTLYRDLDCDGVVDPGEPLVSGPLALTTGQTVCLIVEHQIPAGAPNGAQEQVTLSASYTYVNAAPALSATAQIGDLTTAIAGGGLQIVKTVDRPTARPGDVLTYTVTYRNLGSAPLTSIVINDATPPFTVFVSAGCATLGSGLGGCTVTTAPGAGAAGAVHWTLSGALTPGGSGSVTYQVRVQ